VNERDASETDVTASEDPLLDAEDGPLVERLRHLEWPPVEPELRERGWEQFKQLMKEKEGGEA
jgi:hypothetical protein